MEPVIVHKIPRVEWPFFPVTSKEWLEENGMVVFEYQGEQGQVPLNWFVDLVEYKRDVEAIAQYLDELHRLNEEEKE